MLKGKIAVITGAGNGIGGAIAERFAAEGVKVAITDINLKAAQETAEKIGPSSLAIETDVSNRASVRAMVELSENELGPIDILVNNAGFTELKPFLELDDDSWDKHIDVMLKGTFLCSQTVLKGMVARNSGKIINISSVSGKCGYSQHEAYCSAKFGIIGLTQSMAIEFAGNNININAICPGIVWTQLWEKLAPSLAANRNIPIDQVKTFLMSKIPLGRFCRVEDVAGVAAFLVSKDADYMVGQAINLTGGTVMQ